MSHAHALLMHLMHTSHIVMHPWSHIHVRPYIRLPYPIHTPTTTIPHRTPTNSRGQREKCASQLAHARHSGAQQQQQRTQSRRAEADEAVIMWSSVGARVRVRRAARRPSGGRTLCALRAPSQHSAHPLHPSTARTPQQPPARTLRRSIPDSAAVQGGAMRGARPIDPG